jgi:hypothetical protein
MGKYNDDYAIYRQRQRTNRMQTPPATQYLAKRGENRSFIFFRNVIAQFVLLLNQYIEKFSRSALCYPS